MIVKFLFFALISNFAFGQEDCKSEVRLNKIFMSCSGRSGFLYEKEKLESVLIEYKDNQKVKNIRVTGLSAKDLLSPEKIKNSLLKVGISKPDNLKVLRVGLGEKAPLYKDPESKILSSGCHYLYTPTIISYKKDGHCGDFICNSEVECKSGQKTQKADSLCRAKVIKEGAHCPTAYECLTDATVIIEKYIPPSHPKARGNIRSSQGTRQ